MQDLISALRLEYGDELPEADRALDDFQLKRAITRALLFVNRDFSGGYVLNNDDSISPELEDEHRELLLLRAMVTVCEMMLAKASRKVSFSSGDKKVSHKEQVDAWSRLEIRYLQQYDSAVEATKESGFISPEPMIYGDEVSE